MPSNNLLIAAESGWGKSWYSQAWIEANVPEYDYALVLDFKDEYRGLVKADLASHWIAGPTERDGWDVGTWRSVLEDNPGLVVARYDGLDPGGWREVCATAIAAARSADGSALVAVDEAHFVAPQREGYPDPIKGLATTGRGEGVASLWITQRLTELDETIVSQCQGRVLGGFGSNRDLDKVRPVCEYPVEVHDPRRDDVAGVPEDLGGPTAPPVRKWADGDGIEGSEWVYSDTSGERRRIDTREIDMESTHYGNPGNPLRMP